MRRSFAWSLVIVGLLCASGILPVPAAAAPTANADPPKPPAGSLMHVRGDGFKAGEPGVLFWDDEPVLNFAFDGSGNYDVEFRVPTGARPGNHRVLVCRGVWDGVCWSGPEALDATTDVEVQPPPANTPRPNLQVKAVEVTQGIRESIPQRMPPDGPADLPADAWDHTAYRRTIVRVYPWVSFEDHDTMLRTFRPPLTAELWGRRDGEILAESPLRPANAGAPVPEEVLFLILQRANSGGSLNFVLPPSWTKPGSINLEVRLNPDGPLHLLECDGCSDDNTVRLAGITFETVVNTMGLRHARFPCPTCDAAPSPIWKFEPVLVTLEQHDTAGVFDSMPEPENFVRLIQSLQAMWSISDFNWNLAPPRHQTYHGVVYCWAKGETPVVHKEDYNGCRAGRDIEPFYRKMNSLYPEIPDPDSAGWSRRGWVMPFIWSSDKGCTASWAWRNHPYSQVVDCTVDGLTWDGDSFFEHEVSHSLGLAHAGNSHDESKGGGYDTDFPSYLHGGLEPTAYGMHPYALRALSPFPASDRTGTAPHSHDFMSYGSAPNWISVYHWNRLRKLMGGDEAGESVWSGRSAVAPSDDAVVLSGTVYANGTVELDAAWRPASQSAPSDKPTDPVTVRALDADGVELGQWSAATSAATDLRDDVGRPFEVHAEIPPSARKLAVSHAWLASPHVVRLSAAAPTVAMTGLDEGDVLGETLMPLTWSGDDPDGHDLVYRVEASRDGLEWATLVDATTSTSARLDPASVPGYGSGWTVRVLASDGIRVAEASRTNVSIPVKAPYGYILEPLDGQYFGIGDELILRGQGADWEDGVLLNLTWDLDGEPVGKGPEVRVILSQGGDRRIGMRFANQAGAVGRADITVHVGIDRDRDRLLDRWEADHGLSTWDAFDGERDDDADGLQNWAEQGVGTDPRFADSDGDGDSDGNESRRGGDPTDPSIRSTPDALWPWGPGPEAGAPDDGPEPATGPGPYTMGPVETQTGATAPPASDAWKPVGVPGAGPLEVFALLGSLALLRRPPRGAPRGQPR